MLVKKEKSITNLSRIHSLVEQSQNLLFNELIENSVGLTHSIYTTLGRFYNLNEMEKFISLFNCNSDAEITSFVKKEYNQFDYESKYFSKINSFNTVDDLLTTRLILLKSILNFKPQFKFAFEQYLTFVYEKVVENAVLHKRFQVS